MINTTIESLNNTARNLPVENPVLTYSQVYNKAWSSVVGRFDRMIFAIGFFLVLNFAANILKNFFEDSQKVYWIEKLENISWIVVFVVGLSLCVLTIFNPVKVM